MYRRIAEREQQVFSPSMRIVLAAALVYFICQVLKTFMP
jgi:hypothetical protein